MRFPGITDSNRWWWALATMTSSLSMIMIDQTVVSVALPTMERDLGLSLVAHVTLPRSPSWSRAVQFALVGRDRPVRYEEGGRHYDSARDVDGIRVVLGRELT